MRRKVVIIAAATLLSFLFIMNATAQEAPSSFAKNFGKIGLIYPGGNGIVYFTLVQGDTGMHPKQGYYYVPPEQPNYGTVFNLLTLAAEHNWTVQARTMDKLDENGYARINYIVIKINDN